MEKTRKGSAALLLLTALFCLTAFRIAEFTDAFSTVPVKSPDQAPVSYAAYASGSYDPNAQTFAKRFSKYEAFGIEYVEAESANGCGNVYCNGQLADTFIDITPNGGTFTFQSADGGKIKVQTVYDENGILTGVKTAPAN